MNRSHRLLRLAHSERQARFGVARAPRGFDAYEDGEAVEMTIRRLVGDGHLSYFDWHPAMMEVLLAAWSAVEGDLGGRGLSGVLGRVLAVEALSGRSKTPDGRVVLGGRDRATTEACAALGEALVLDRFLRAAGEALRRRALVDHRQSPAWPEGYLERRAREDADDLAKARAEASGIGGPLGDYAGSPRDAAGPEVPASEDDV